MSQTLPEHVSNRWFIDQKLDGARFQIDSLQQQMQQGGNEVAAQSCACAAVSQMLQAVSALLHSFNQQLPDPLPASRVSLRHLRDAFHGVEAESRTLRPIEQALRSGGWLEQLENLQQNSAFGPLLTQSGGSYRMFRNPLDPSAGTEEQDPVSYLNGALSKTRELLQQVAQEMPDDVARFREAHRRQFSQRL